MENKNKKKRFPIAGLLIVLVCLGGFGFAASKVLDFYKPDIEIQSEVQELIDIAVTTVPPTDEETVHYTIAPDPTQADATAYATDAAATDAASQQPADTAQPDKTPGPSASEAAPATAQPTSNETAAPGTPEPDPTDSEPAHTDEPVSTHEATPAPGTTPASTPAPTGTPRPATQTPAPTQPGSPTPTPPPYSGPPSPLNVDFNALQSINSDICAWLYSKDTPINYPVMYSSDNIYYLDHLYNGSHNSGGSLFVDYRCSRYFTDVNTLIFGHNNKSGSMFGTLKGYKSQSYYNQHPYMWLYTPGHAYRLDIIVGLITTSNSDPYTLFNSTDELHDFLRTAKANSTFDSGFYPDTIDKIVTLSTCSYEYTNARFVVIGHPVQCY